MKILIVLLFALILMAIFTVFAALSAIAELWKDEEKWRNEIDKDETM